MSLNTGRQRHVNFFQFLSQSQQLCLVFVASTNQTAYIQSGIHPKFASASGFCVFAAVQLRIPFFLHTTARRWIVGLRWLQGPQYLHIQESDGNNEEDPGCTRFYRWELTQLNLHRSGALQNLIHVTQECKIGLLAEQEVWIQQVSFVH